MNIELETQNEESATSHSIVATIDGKGVGYGAARIFLTQLEIKNIIVQRDARQQGVGKAILAELEEWGIDHAAKTAWAELSPIDCHFEELAYFFNTNGYAVICGLAEKKFRNNPTNG